MDIDLYDERKCDDVASENSKQKNSDKGKQEHGNELDIH